MKKAVSCILLLSLLFTLAACGEEDGASSEAVISVNTGMGSVNTLTVGDDAAVIKTTVAAVVVDENGKIRACQLDEVETRATAKEGKIVRPKETRTKHDQLFEYGLASKSPIKREWFEQAASFGEYVEGMTADEVASLPLENGKLKDSALKARCDLDVTDFAEAITRAVRSARPLGAAAEDKLSMALSFSDDTSKSADFLHGMIHMATVTLNPNGVVSSCLVDVAEAEVRLQDGKLTGHDGDYPTNKEKKNDLMVETTSSEGVGWYEQAGAFEKYVTGKTPAQIKATPLENGYAAKDTELAKTCTVRVSAMLDNLLRAIAASSSTGETAATSEGDAESASLVSEGENLVSDVVSDVVSTADDVLSDVESMIS